jgi:hypothetical protein
MFGCLKHIFRMNRKFLIINGNDDNNNDNIFSVSIHDKTYNKPPKKILKTTIESKCYENIGCGKRKWTIINHMWTCANCHSNGYFG